MLNFKDLPESAGTPKTLGPGNITAKVYDIKLLKGYKENSLHVVLLLEGEDMGAGFEGFLVDPDNKMGPRFKGQVGRIKLTQWAYEDGVTPSGYVVNRDENIMKALRNLSKALGKMDEIINIEAKTIEEVVEKAAVILKGDAFLNWTVAGREYDKDGYTNYDLFLPKPGKNEVVYEIPGTVPSKLVKFDASKHIIENVKNKPASDEFEPTEKPEAGPGEFQM